MGGCDVHSERIPAVSSRSSRMRRRREASSGRLYMETLRQPFPPKPWGRYSRVASSEVYVADIKPWRSHIRRAYREGESFR